MQLIHVSGSLYQVVTAGASHKLEHNKLARNTKAETLSSLVS